MLGSLATPTEEKAARLRRRPYMRVLPIGLAIVRSSGVLLVGIGLMVVVFASRQVNPWPQARVGAAIAAIGVGVFLVVRTVSPRYRQCPACEREP